MAQTELFNPDPAPTAAPPPKILSNQPRNAAVMHVEYSLPGLRRAVVHVPYDRWQAGGHAKVGQAVADMLSGLGL